MDPVDTDKPVRAAKAAAIQNAVWLNPTGPTLTPVKKKRRRSPDMPPAPVKQKHRHTSSKPSASASTSLGTGIQKARIVGNMRTPNPKAKSRKHKTAQPSQDQARANTKLKHKPVAPRLDAIQIDIDDSDKDGLLNEDGEDIDNDQPVQENAADSSEELTSIDLDDHLELDARDVRVRFEEEDTNWGTGVNTGVHEDGSEPGGQPPNTSTEDKDSESPEPAKPINKQAANRLAEVPQWDLERPDDVASTCTDSGTPLSSGEEGDAEIDEVQQATKGHAVNRGWPRTCHYLPARPGRPLISLRSQPAALKMIIRAAINRTTADLIFENTYRPVDELTQYYHHLLWASARRLNFVDYTTRFNQDANFGKAVGWVLTGHVSIFRGQVKRNAANKVEGYYHLVNGQPGIDQIKKLHQGSTYIYPMKIGPDGQNISDRSKPFAHPAIIALLRDTFFTNVRGGSFASRNQPRFKSSLDAKPKELEIPGPMLALVATSIHSALDDYGNGTLRKTDFNADMYEDVYRTQMTFLAHIREESLTKYHCMMANIYATASNVFTPRATAVTNETISQLDLAAMEE